MKPMKSIVLLTVGALAFSSCSKKADDNQTTETGNQDTTMGAGTSPVSEPAPVTEPIANQPATTDQGSGVAPAPITAPVDRSSDEGSGAVSDDISDDELNSDQMGDEGFISDEENLPTDSGTGATSDDSEYVDETSSEPDDVRGGRDARMVPKYEGIDNTSSEPDRNQME